MRTETGKGLGKDPKTHYTLHLFDDLDDYIKQADACPADYYRVSAHVGKEYNGLDYFGTESFDEARNLATNGWRDVRQQVEGFLAPVRIKLAETLSTHTVRVHDLVGYEPDIDRYLAGEMDCMWDDWMIEEPHNGKVFTLLVDASLTWDNKATEVLQRGATLCALVEAYTMLGYQLECWVENSIGSWGDSGKIATFLTRINNAGEPIDIDRMMFALGHPDMLRRLAFRVGEGITVMRDEFGFNGGYYGLARRGLHFTKRVGANSTVTLDGNRTMLDAETWILNQLEEQGLWEGE